MPCTGWKLPADADDLANTAVTWLNIGRLRDGQTGSRASCSFIADATTDIGSTTEIDTFGFQNSIPPRTLIKGIKVQTIEGASAGAMTHNIVRLFDGTSAVGDDKATGAWVSNDANTFFGDPNDLWGLTTPDADVRQTAFGIHISMSDDAGAGGVARALFDALYIQVWWGGHTRSRGNSLGRSPVRNRP